MKILVDGEDGIRIDEKALKAVKPTDIKVLQIKLSNENLYVDDKNAFYADGKPGGLTAHAIAVAADENFAVRYIAEKSLRDNRLDESEIMKLQTSLNRLGYEAGTVDGKFGGKTARAIKSFLEEHPEEAANIDPSLKKMLGGKLPKGAMMDVFQGAVEKSETANVGHLPRQTAEGHALLRPELLEFIEKHPGKRAYIEMAFDSAQKYGLDPRMFANQIYQESDNLDPHAKGIQTKSGRALGITQMLPGTAKQYGLSKDELLDPKKAIDAAARHMAQLTEKNGSQALALVEYNGGGKAIETVERALKTKDITVDDWMDFMQKQRERHGTDDRSKWRVQTYEYVQNVVPEFWTDKKVQKALEKPENKDAIQKPAEPSKDENEGTRFAGDPKGSESRQGIKTSTLDPLKLGLNFDRATDQSRTADITNPTPTTPKGPAFSGQTLG